MMGNEKKLPLYDLTGEILTCCFEVMKELGPGFQEKVYKNALYIALTENELSVEAEKSFTVTFRGKIIGRYSADLVVENAVIVELKCCECLAREHQAQLFNYLKVSQLPVGLLVNFQQGKLEYKRLHRPKDCVNYDLEEKVPF
ncbi:MAG TPA: GxxExxY protein [Chlamydiales bacterium]|nr:GxxExxY protein [Chlamydiales bacterium]